MLSHLEEKQRQAFYNNPRSVYDLFPFISFSPFYSMRKITQQAISAFLIDTSFSLWNTTIKREWVYTRLYLHWNEIAFKLNPENSKRKEIHISNAWYPTNTTKERLNGIPWVHIIQKQGKWYLNGTEWDGSWITI